MTEPRRFVLERIEDETGVSGTRWCVTDVRQTCVWASMDDVRYVHGHQGKTAVR